MIRRFQNRVATSRAALPLMSIYGALVCIIMLAADYTLWSGLLIFVVNVYLMVELNNRNTLMRQYSRMVSCSYIAMMCMLPSLLCNWRYMFVQMCLIAHFSLLFKTYQNGSALGYKYWAYLFIGLASLVWPPVLYFLPFMWLAESVFLMSYSLKAFMASVLAVLTPLWILLPYVIYAELYDDLLQLYSQLLPSETLIQAFSHPASLLSIILPAAHLSQLLPIAGIFVLLAVGIVHYLRNSYSDKIHVRMLYNVFILISLLSALFAVLVTLLCFQERQSFSYLLSFVVVCASPLLAHYMAFTYTRLTNISVMIIMILLAVGAAFSMYDIVPSDLSGLQNLVDTVGSIIK